MMSLAVDPEPVPLTRDKHGAWRVGGTRVTLETLAAAFDRGDSPEEIHERYPSVALGGVYAVLTYCLRHPVSVKEYLTAREAAGPRCKPASRRRSLPKACAPVWCRGSGSERPLDAKRVAVAKRK